MYVIADIEWVDGNAPTQLAAVRVDSEWNVTDEFRSFVGLRENTVFDPKHVAYAGGKFNDFFYAPTQGEVFSSFLKWLGNDTVLWWFSPSREVFEGAISELESGSIPVSQVLCDYLVNYIYGGKPRIISSYNVAKALDISLPIPEHYSKNDVDVILKIIEKVGFPQALLTEPPRRDKKHKSVLPYYFDEEKRIMHRKGCLLVSADDQIIGHATLNACFKNGCRVCKCLRKEFTAERRKRVDDIISRAEYKFCYAVGGSVYHYHSCKLLRNAKNILGCATFDGITKKALRPCKVCAPDRTEDADPMREWLKRKGDSVYYPKPKSKPLPKPRKLKGYDGAVNRPLSHEEGVAVVRFQQARRERLAGAPKDVLMEREKADFFTRTQPRFAFFAARGYRNFHLRSCNKLSGITGLNGFATFEEAHRAGFTPCKNCKPSPKSNVTVSIPIYNEVRDSESVSELLLYCEGLGLECKSEPSKFYVSTPVGRWIVNTDSRPVTVEHINLAKEPKCTKYHRQHRIFLSITDAIVYIHRHDCSLQGIEWDANIIP